MTKWTLEDSVVFQFQEDPSSKNVERIGKIYHEVSLSMKFSQTETK